MEEIKIQSPRAIELEKNGRYIFLMPENYSIFDALNIANDLVNIFSTTIQENNRRKMSDIENTKQVVEG